MKVLYFDCFAGAAGDMILGALLDAGLPFEALTRALGSLAVEGWDVSADRVINKGITATKFRVHEHAHSTHRTHVRTSTHSTHHHDHGHHSLSEIYTAIERSALSVDGKARAIRMFKRLGEAEAAIHGIPIDEIHLHEVGALDSIIDIVGAVFAIEWFNADRIVVSPINVGSGMVRTEHGVFPVPAPATLSLLKKCSGLFERHPVGAADADRRARPHRIRVGVWSNSADDDRQGRLRRRRPGTEGHPERCPGVDRRSGGTQGPSLHLAKASVDEPGPKPHATGLLFSNARSTT